MISSKKIDWRGSFFIGGILLLLAAELYAKNGANDDDQDSLYELPLEELLNIDISVASIKQENIANTPAVVSSYTAEDLSKLGLRSLKDVISFVPGFVVDRNVSGTPQIMVRGAASDFGAKILVLLNGVPYWSPSHSNIPVLGIPWAAIDKVEIIRGPGAVIYGSNAIAGVINVITKETPGGSIQVDYGSNPTVNSTGYYRYSSDGKESGSGVVIAYEKQHEDDGYDAEVRQLNQVVAPAKYQQKELFESIFIQFKHEYGQVFLSYFNDFTEGATVKVPPFPTPGLPPPIPGELIDSKVPDVKTEGLLLHGDYQWGWQEHSLSVFADYNQYAPAFLSPDMISRFDDSWQDNFRFRTGLLAEGSVNEIVDYLAGIETELRKVDDFRNIPKNSGGAESLLFSADDVREDTVYGQLDFHRDNWRVLVGARATDNEASGFKITPRTSLVYSIDKQQSLKLLYSVGFTSPNFETNITASGSSLKPETIKMLDLVYSYVTPEKLFVANVYYYEGEDFITRFPAPPPFLLFTNRDPFSRKGVELDYQIQLKSSRLHANLAYNHEGNRTGINNDAFAALVPELTVNIGGHYRLQSHLFGASLRYISQRQIADSSADLAINYQYKKNGLTLFATVNNLLSDELIAVNFSPGGISANQRNDNKINFTLGFKFDF
ncbi:TonB-dependent receptor [Endozoicomonas sp. SM1973]|uniref:TonB-dependent receptor n=1 Tax=Spartinivicinus marinus TaxID=2994442 RepID=A0A853I8R7_9GAMM|nr:TonB-dependent receptor [Spartinivicinus marinus]MCX4025226.1 TonB-dependent receptor [Spartinivicinus marinus]NYZ65947.1 TonB-dependent receptor [Spartinivicinus marinus]